MTQITTTNVELIQPSANRQTLTDEQFMLLKEDGNLYKKSRKLQMDRSPTS